MFGYLANTARGALHGRVWGQFPGPGQLPGNQVGNAYWWTGLLHDGIELLTLIAFFILAFYLIRRLSVRLTSGKAFAILQERYARGEIDHQDYVTRKKELQK